jgi:ATP-dependent DNA helicase RecG
MLSEAELLDLMADLESDRIERTVSEGDMDKFCIAACCFANDFPRHGKPVGVTDRGAPSGLRVTDRLLRTLGEVRANGNVLPLPEVKIYKMALSDHSGEVAVMEILPSDLPPVRYKGQVWIRTGPRRAVASETEERRLTERRVSFARTFDARPCRDSTITDLATELFLNTYRLQAVASEVVEQNNRDLREQLAALRFFDLAQDCPTNAGVLLFGKDPRYWMSGAYVQFLRLSSSRLESTEVVIEKEVGGDLLSVLRELDLLLDTQLAQRLSRFCARRQSRTTRDSRCGNCS